VQGDATATRDSPVQTEQRRRATTEKVIGDSSPPLQAAAGSFAQGNAACGGNGELLSCGYETSATNDQLLNVFVTSVGPNPERSECEAIMRRTATTGSVAGAKIRAVAIYQV